MSDGTGGGRAGGAGRGGPRDGHPGGPRRNEQGRERNRGGAAPRRFSTSAPSQRKRIADPARLAAFEVLRAVATEDAYANLVLPARIRDRGLDRRDAGFATELAYGALRGQGLYDAILARCVDRPLDQLDPAILDALRLGAHQVLAMRVPTHAALDETVGLARAVIGAGPSGLVNAVLRKVAARSLDAWIADLLEGVTEPAARDAIAHSHPEWIVRAMRQSLVAHGRSAEEIGALLEADNLAPVVNLVALPGLGDLEEALASGAEPGTLAPDSAYSAGGELSRLRSVRAGTTRVQDAGSQLVARALAGVPLEGRDTDWLDLCAGPGGKAALLAALAAERGAELTANEPAPHRAELVRKALVAVPRDAWSVVVGDGRRYAGIPADQRFDRIMVDAPCSGLGALRRRPESRWRKTPRDIAELTILQGELLDAALAAIRPGGVVAYVTCSPHPAETLAVVEDALRRHPSARLLDAGSAIDGVGLAPLDAAHPMAGGSTVQLWPHLHRTDAMFLALITLDAGTPAQTATKG
ncbi:RsmB/NOP family class I SAM-dependent RNA methyltransferase [Arthrobacter halodurans]|uniref:RsmB/NOP family class I SAM-dependent RNA methyltransferase n=1 Tax=Arthrobacter halodurans TaxID=516699 RepID=A0ABV4UPD4_9MICC